MFGYEWGISLPERIAAMSGHLDYFWTFCLEMTGPSCAVYGKKISQNWKPILAYCKGKYSGSWIVMDRIPSSYRDKRFHKWGQNENPIQFLILATDSQLILDPFCGGGTVPAVCKMLGRHYLAFEIEPDVAERARERVARTQPPLFVLQPEQVEFEI